MFDVGCLFDMLLYHKPTLLIAFAILNFTSGQHQNQIVLP